MATALSNVRLQLEFFATLSETREGQTARAEGGVTFVPATAFTSGTTANKADRWIQDLDRSLASAATESLDLYDYVDINPGPGTGRDLIGNVVTVAEIVLLAIHNDSTSTGSLIIGGEGSAAAWNSPFNASDTAKVGPFGPDGWCIFYRPDDPAFAVADTSNHLLKIEASGGAVTYDLFIMARSA